MLLFACVGMAMPAEAETPATSIVVSGLEAYKTGGATEAIQGWIKGSGLEGSKEALSQANVLRQVEEFYGEYQGFDIIRDHEMSPRVHMIVFVMNYEKGPLFSRFQSYLSDSGKWVATEFKLHTEANMILPNNVVFGR